ncbi:MAG: pitrilysin family protein [Desulfovibrionaceae bacterium]
MFRHFLLFGLLLMTVSCAGKPLHKDVPAATGNNFAQALSQAEAPLVTRLENGLTVLIKEDDRFPLVNVRLYVHAGSAYEDPAQAGISHLLEHMVFKGSAGRAPGETARVIESVGGSLNAGTSWDYTVYYVEVPDEEWKLGLETVRDMSFHANIDPAELAPEKEVVLSELERGEDTPGSKLFKTLQSMVWTGTSYQWPIIGYRETVSGLQARDIKDYIARLYQPQSMLLVVTGKIDAANVLKEIRATYGGYANTRGVEPTNPITLPVQTEPQLTVIPGKWNKVYLGLAFPIPDLGSAKATGLEVLGQLLGGDDTSLLYRKFKYDKRLVDDISTYALTLDRVGMFYVSATLDQANLDAFWAELLQTLDGLSATDFGDQELERAKLNLADSLFLAKETLSGLASKLGSFQFFYGGQNAEANYLYELSRVDRSELTALMREYLRPDRLSGVLLVPEDATADASALKQSVEQHWKTPTDKSETKTTAKEGNVTEVSLPGGSTLVLLPDHTLPYTALSIYWPGGDGELTREQQGLAVLSANALTRGTASMTATQIEDFLSDRAASASAMAGRDTFAFNAKYPAWFADDVLPLFEDMLTGPTWPVKEIDRAKQDQVASIKLREDKPLGLAFRRIFPFLFQSGPYSYFHAGRTAEVASFSPDAVKEFWQRQSERPFVLAVCGTFDPEQIQGFAARLATELTKPGDDYAYVAPQWSTDKTLDLQLPDRNQAHLLTVFPVPGTEDLEASAGLTLLRAALSGQSGLLFRDLRDKQGLGYTVTSLLWQAPKAGFMAFYIGTDPDKVEQAEAGFEKTVAMLREAPLPGMELERAWNVINGEYYQDHQTLLSRSRQAANLLVQGLERDMEKKLIDRAKTLTPEDIQKLAREYLIWKQGYTVKVLP